MTPASRLWHLEIITHKRQNTTKVPSTPDNRCHYVYVKISVNKDRDESGIATYRSYSCEKKPLCLFKSFIKYMKNGNKFQLYFYLEPFTGGDSTME